MLAGALEVAGGDEPFGGGVAREAVRAERLGCDAPRLQRLLPVALQLVDRGQPALAYGERPPRLRRACRGHLAQRSGGVRELARELRAARVALEELQPLLGTLTVRPQLQRLASEPRGVPVRVDGLVLADRAEQRVEGPLGLASREPVGRHLRARVPAVFEQLGELAVQRPASQPWDVRVQRVAHEGMAEGGAARADLEHQTGADERLEPGIAAQRGEQVELEADAADGGRLRGGARLGCQGSGAQEHGVANRLRQRHGSLGVQDGGARVVAQDVARAQHCGELLDEEGTPCVRACSSPPSGAETRMPSTASASSTVSEGVRGSSTSSRSSRSRRRWLRSRRSGWRRSISSDRYAPTTSTGRSRSGAAMVARSSSVASSDHCRSSRRTTAGPARPIVARAQRIASKSVARSLASTASPSSGSSRARWPRSGPHRASPSGVSCRYRRSAATIGAYGGADGMAAPRSRATPAARETSSTSRVLPTPASPVTRTSAPRPPAASATASASHGRVPRRPISGAGSIRRRV